jgi:HK97 gp10 family phage protein
MGVEVHVSGIPDFKAALQSIVPKLRKRALRNALAAGARVVRDEAQRNTPMLRVPAPHRKPGTVKKAITVRTSKIARRRGDVGVFVNVKPAKAGQRGAKSDADPFYWRWLNFGWNPAGYATGGYGRYGRRLRRKMNKSGSPKIRSGFRFLEAGARKLGQALEIFKAKIGPQIQRLNGGKDVQL